MTALSARISRLSLGCLLFLPACNAGVAPTVTPTAVSTNVPAAGDTVFIASNSWSTSASSPFELLGVGGNQNPTRLTFCQGCQTTLAAPSLDRNRVAALRAIADTTGDGRVDEQDRASLVLLDLARQIQGPFLPDGWTTSSVDWTSNGQFLVHSSSADGSPEDLYTVDADAQNNARLLFTPTVRERGARLNPAVTRVVYERIDGTGAGKSEIWVWASSTTQTRITDSGITGAQLPNSLYLVGSDAGPDYSPDGASVVFRRLTSTDVAGGAWDILVTTSAGGAPRVIASGPQYRSAPDWSKDGILFTEQNLATGGLDLVAVDPSSGSRRVITSFARGYRTGPPRWIAGIAG